MNREQEVWAVALWVEKKHPDDGAGYIAKQVERLAMNGDAKGVAMWRAVADRYDALERPEMEHGTN